LKKQDKRVRTADFNRENRRSSGTVFVISAPSGAGKTTLCRKLIHSHHYLRQSVSYTTRKPRRGETPDVDYSFIDEKTFRYMIRKGDFLEWAEVHGHLYGTSKKRLAALLKSGADVILDIDTQGAAQIRKSGADAVYIFILPPTMSILKERLSKRKSNTEKDIQGRLKRARIEIKDLNKYDYVIVNNRVTEALRHLEAIITAVSLESHTVSKKFIKYVLTH
jgi:guanylate kinase